MLTVIWGGGGFHVVALMTSRPSFDSQDFVEKIMLPLVEKVFPKRRNPHARRLHLQLDDCRVHFSRVAERFFAQNHISRPPQPAFSPILAPSDFWLLGCRKNSFAGQMLDDPEGLLEPSHHAWMRFSLRNCTSFSATWERGSDGFWRTMETTITNKSFVDRNISRFVHRRAGATTS
jgi:hypothetical protein